MATPNKDEEQVELATAEDDQQITKEDDVDEEETEIKQKLSDSKCSRQKIIILSVIIFIVLCGIAVLIWALVTLNKDNDDDNKMNEDEIDIDIENWSYNLLLSKDIDSSGLEHGIIYKQLNLSKTDTGIHRIDFDEYYQYDGPIGYTQTWLNAQSRTVYGYALAYENVDDERFLNYAINGMDGIFNYFYDDVYDGYFRSITLYDNGTRIISDSIKDVYQHQFLIKSLSKLYQITLNETYLNEAMRIYNILWTNFTDSTGVGVYSKKTRNFANVTSSSKHTNDMLHFFDCSLKLYEAYETFHDFNSSNNNNMLLFIENKINKIYEFIMDVRVNLSVINENGERKRYLVFCEHYTNDWKPDPNMLIIDNVITGHSFELCAFLWKCIDLDVIAKTNENIANAHSLFEYSVDLSFNETNGALDYKYFNTTLDWYWWHITQWWMGIEALRTITYYNYNYHDSWTVISPNFFDHQYIKEMQQKVLKWYNDNYYDSKYGGMYGQPVTNDYRKGHQWKVGYHTIDATLDILNIIQFKFN